MELLNKFVTYEGFTFDDVLLEPRYSEVTPSQVCVKSFFTPKIALNIPICLSLIHIYSGHETRGQQYV